MHHAFLYISFPSLRNFTSGKSLISRFVEDVDCKTVRFFFSKSVKKSVKRGVTVLRAPQTPVVRVRREKNFWRLSPVSLSVFSLVPDLLFDCSPVLEYAKIRTVLQSMEDVNTRQRISFSFPELQYSLLD